MAKGIRSKVKRRNRTQLRKTIMEPIQNHRQLVINNKQKKFIEYKKQTTLTGLKNTLTSPKNDKTESDDDMEDEDVEEIVTTDSASNDEVAPLVLQSDYVDKTVKKYNRDMSWLK
uniref:DUF2423 domain-containing protein n=1 Tax=Chromulina nebulosa TaxID=96789 RepID=A0A7S0SX87_9STRA|mmetsp:Transcript_730/g.637  ORF Transcript_730/g.637 Transcript_730/m.637 type:complete len:115 (+) Transcript_730:56-400(+)